MAGTGQLERITVTAGGTGYTSAPTVTVADPAGTGLHTTATATAILDSAGGVAAVLLTTPGRGYLTAPAVSFSGGGGTGAAATAVLGLASYATIAQFRAYLTETTTTVADDGLVQDVLDRATGICNNALTGLGFAFAGYTVAARAVRAPAASPYLLLPPHQPGSLTSVVYGATVYRAGTDYTVLPDTTGGLGYGELLYRGIPQAWGTSGWAPAFYTLTAAWGYGPPPPEVVEVCLEVAINIWQARKAGRFTNVIGTDAGAVGYEGALTPLQRAVLAGVKAIYTRTMVAL